MLISVVQTHTHAKRHTNPLKIWRCIIDANVNFFLLRSGRNFAPVKEGVLKCLDLTPSQKYASDVKSGRYSRFQGKMTIPGYQLRDFLQFLQRKMRE